MVRGVDGMGGGGGGMYLGELVVHKGWRWVRGRCCGGCEGGDGCWVVEVVGRVGW